ncbi:Uncharacterised protein [Bordetella pertussis]|nr:Uncharacterised protein [Bordetella pertussis]CFW29582.1 Uncharacterised protein [Bordetella pertussis]CPM52622.1 Uncharacterised protein [Bordetella pertussis]
MKSLGHSVRLPRISVLVLNDMLTIQYSGSTANSRYSARKIPRQEERRSAMAALLVQPAGGAGALHPVVKHEAQQQDD